MDDIIVNDRETGGRYSDALNPFLLLLKTVILASLLLSINAFTT
jgi:hypothetical protein